MLYHKPVLLQPALNFLDVKPDAKYVDATYGGGGHTAAIKAAGGLVLTIDQDPAVKADVHDNFIHLNKIIKTKHWQPLMGILFDFGPSMLQIGDSQRGFSVKTDGPLDMRMDPSSLHTAATLVNQLPVSQLTSLLENFGEIRGAKKIVGKIITNRPVVSSGQLRKLIDREDLARQVFQALRIAVNDELGAIQVALPQALENLQSGGRLVAISFHSLEDRLVKQQIQDWHRRGLIKVLTPKPISGERGSKLRAVEKL